eukprot:6488695-Amphidinium_carterae.1
MKDYQGPLVRNRESTRATPPCICAALVVKTSWDRPPRVSNSAKRACGGLRNARDQTCVIRELNSPVLVVSKKPISCFNKLLNNDCRNLLAARAPEARRCRVGET